MSYEPAAIFYTPTSWLFASPNPSSFFKQDILKDYHITDVVMLLENGVLKKKYEERKINVLHCPIQDFKAPTQEQLHEWVPQIIRLIMQPNRNILVHCQAGLGRTGIIIACLAVSILKLKAPEAIQFTRDRIRGAIETKEQEKAIELFANSVLAAEGYSTPRGKRYTRFYSCSE